MIHRHQFPISDIVVGDRTRQEFRNVDSLARSISERGLLSPLNLRIGEDDRKVLVCGGRRLAAVKSLGWEAVDVLIIEDELDELDALYAEGDENTEREPFTPAEAVRHRQRIKDVEAKAAKVRQGTRTDLQPSSKLEPSAPRPKPHETKTRHRTAKATGYSASSLDKAEKIIEAAEDEAAPEPVRKVARTAARNLEQPGAKVDREFKAYRQEVERNNPDVRAANYRKALTTALGRVTDLYSYEPDRIREIADADLLRLIDETCDQLDRWHQQIKKTGHGLRVVGGDK